MPSFSNVSVTTTATKILSANQRRDHAVVINYGTVTVFLGFLNTVTASNGFPMRSGESVNVTYRGEIYGIVSSGTCDVRYLEL